MTTIAEIPILTPQTLNLLAKAISPNQHQLLRERIERIKPLFESFLTEDGSEVHEAFLIASSRYAYPRLEILFLLLSIVLPLGLARLFSEIGKLGSDMVTREGWRLGSGAWRLRNAWGTYVEIGKLLGENMGALSQIRSLPYGWLMSSTKVDFGLTATTMYLEGEFPHVSVERLMYLCEVAESETSNAKLILTEMVLRADNKREESNRLRRLFGSWEGNGDFEGDLKNLYNSRLSRNSSPS